MPLSYLYNAANVHVLFIFHNKFLPKFKCIIESGQVRTGFADSQPCVQTQVDDTPFALPQFYPLLAPSGYVRRRLCCLSYFFPSWHTRGWISNHWLYVAKRQWDVFLDIWQFPVFWPLVPLHPYWLFSLSCAKHAYQESIIRATLYLPACHKNKMDFYTLERPSSIASPQVQVFIF